MITRVVDSPAPDLCIHTLILILLRFVGSIPLYDLSTRASPVTSAHQTPSKPGRAYSNRPSCTLSPCRPTRTDYKRHQGRGRVPTDPNFATRPAPCRAPCRPPRSCPGCSAPSPPSRSSRPTTRPRRRGPWRRRCGRAGRTRGRRWRRRFGRCGWARGAARWYLAGARRSGR